MDEQLYIEPTMDDFERFDIIFEAEKVARRGQMAKYAAVATAAGVLLAGAGDAFADGDGADNTPLIHQYVPSELLAAGPITNLEGLRKEVVALDQACRSVEGKSDVCYRTQRDNEAVLQDVEKFVSDYEVHAELASSSTGMLYAVNAFLPDAFIVNQVEDLLRRPLPPKFDGDKKQYTEKLAEYDQKLAEFEQRLEKGRKRLPEVCKEGKEYLEDSVEEMMRNEKNRIARDEKQLPVLKRVTEYVTTKANYMKRLLQLRKRAKALDCNPEQWELR